jgi:hypothetical protein
MNARCRHCWRGLFAFVTVYIAYFETRAFRSNCHRTLSREVRELGPCGVFLPVVAGALFTAHLITLKDACHDNDDHDHP